MKYSLRHIPTALPLALAILALFLATLAQPHAATASGTWNGLLIAPENRCSPYDRDHYSYPQSVELDIIASMQDRIYGPYTGRYFSNRRQTDIELCDVQHNSINVALTIMLRRAWLLWPRAGAPRITAT